MPVLSTDAYGHRANSNNGVGANLTAGAVGTSAAGTIAGTTAAGAAPTVTFGTNQAANDTAGSFTLNPVTGGGAQAAGSVALVTFTQPYSTPPKGVIVNMCDNAAGTSQVAVVASSQNVTTTGFNVNVSTALTTAHNYTVSYIVLP